MSYQSEYSGAQVDEAVGKALNPDATPTADSTNLVQSGGVASAVSAVMGTVSHRNLLDNPWFTVNQRGATTGTASTNDLYFVDRWMASKCAYTVNNDGTITITPSNNAYGIYQKIDRNTLDLVGKTLTLSVMMSDGTVYSETKVFSASAYGDYIAPNVRFYYGVASTIQQFWITTASGNSLTIRAMKLELGSISTLATDAPPNFAEELAKCQRYLYVLTPVGTSTPFVGTGVAIAGTQASIFVPLPVTMRSAPTPAYSGTVKVWHGATIGSSGINMTGFSGAGLTRNGVAITVTVSSGLTTGEFCMLQLRESSPSITLSAEL